MKIAIVYSSIHHSNTKKLIEGIKQKVAVDLIEATRVDEKKLEEYDIIGLASGIYGGKGHQQIQEIIEKNSVLCKGKKVFLILTSGSNGKKYGLEEQAKLENRGCKVLGTFKCKGYDTYGIFNLVGGISKTHPDIKDISEATAFVKGLK